MKVKLKKYKKSPAPVAAEQAEKHFNTLSWIYSRIKEIREVSEISEACVLLKTEEWICLKIFIKNGIATFAMCRCE